MVKKLKGSSLFFLIILSVALVAADQAVKMLARGMAEPIVLVKGMFSITTIMNSGIAFGLLQGQNNIVIWLYIVVLGLILFFYDRFPDEKFERVMLFMVIAGIVGNFIDRAALGYVTDFIYFHVWPAFNLADAYLTIGIAGLIGKELFRKKTISVQSKSHQTS